MLENSLEENYSINKKLIESDNKTVENNKRFKDIEDKENTLIKKLQDLDTFNNKKLNDIENRDKE